MSLSDILLAMSWKSDDGRNPHLSFTGRMVRVTDQNPSLTRTEY